ncbi:hypothetical protein [Methylobacterium sp. ap11]|uniref:hypothetical protein n=1 Tax=Methylobacterium sp. ap11 TaxID=1761799 RepID=UPI0015A58877|nr:hypothetical protein [Methylobacterium sp. ap11]
MSISTDPADPRAAIRRGAMTPFQVGGGGLRADLRYYAASSPESVEVRWQGAV